MSDNKHPSWQRLNEKTVYKGRMHIVEHAAILPNGEQTKYEVDHGNGAVATLIKTPDDEIILSYQFRFPLNKWIYDLPGGGKQENESVEAAAVRECQEEVGIAPKILKQMAMFYPNPGRGDWPVHVFFCDDYEASELTTDDPSETVERVLMSVARFKLLVDNQEIVDPTLLIAWYTACDKGYILF